MNYFRSAVAGLPSTTGTNNADGSRSSTGQAGFISYGPYLLFEPGRYFAGFHVRRVSQPSADLGVRVDVAIDTGETVMFARDVPQAEILAEIAGLVGLHFELEEPRERVEVRLWVDDDVEITVTEIVIFRV